MIPNCVQMILFIFNLYNTLAKCQKTQQIPPF
jgi:hypothetical protein